jgi:hypothetical protein
MTKIILAATAAAAIFATTPFLLGATPAQAQRVEIGPGGVEIDSGRRDRDRRRCVTEYTTRVTPSGRTIREKKTVCRSGGRGYRD